MTDRDLATSVGPNLDPVQIRDVRTDARRGVAHLPDLLAACANWLAGRAKRVPERPQRPAGGRTQNYTVPNLRWVHLAPLSHDRAECAFHDRGKLLTIYAQNLPRSWKSCSGRRVGADEHLLGEGREMASLAIVHRAEDQAA